MTSIYVIYRGMVNCFTYLLSMITCSRDNYSDIRVVYICELQANWMTTFKIKLLAIYLITFRSQYVLVNRICIQRQTARLASNIQVTTDAFFVIYAISGPLSCQVYMPFTLKLSCIQWWWQISLCTSCKSEVKTLHKNLL